MLGSTLRPLEGAERPDVSLRKSGSRLAAPMRSKNSRNPDGELTSGTDSVAEGRRRELAVIALLAQQLGSRGQFGNNAVWRI